MARSHDAKAETSGQKQSVEQFIFTHIQKHPANGQTPRTQKHCKTNEREKQSQETRRLKTRARKKKAANTKKKKKKHGEFASTNFPPCSGRPALGGAIF